MNVTSIAQQHTHNNKSVNQTQNSTANFQDELDKHQGGRWKNHYIEGLTPSQNQALNNKLEEMGITSDEEIYQIKSKMERTMITYESLGWSPSNYTENHIRSLEYSKNMGGFNNTDKNVLEVLYAIQENDLKSPNIQNTNQTQNSTVNFQDELDKHQGGRWKNHYIEGLSTSQNQALNNKLDEMGITSDYEIYKIKAQIATTMMTYESLGWSPSNYTENHIRSLEYSKNNGGLSDLGNKILQVLYAIQENDLKNPSIENESNKYLSNAINKLLYDEKNKTDSIENSKHLQIKSQASEYVSFQREIEQSNRNSSLNLSV